MTFRGDPYVALGLSATATLADVKRAYRVLAKRHHPDAAKGSVARFLEVQAAYEALIRGDRSDTGPPTGAQPPGRRPPGTTARATGPRRATGEPPPSAPHAAHESGAGPAPGRGRRRRDPRTATLGSTTYDEAIEVVEPAWDGADWYGPTSGTYWTVNPKEYADPRKHGPEYLARWAAARRTGGRARPAFGAAPGTTAHDPAEAAHGETASRQAARREAPSRRRDAGSEARGGEAARGERDTLEREPDQRETAQRATASVTPPDLASTGMPRPEAARSRVAARPSSTIGPRVTGPAWPGPALQIVAGVLGWLPFGVLLAAAVGLPGGLVATLPIQVAGLAVMLWSPRVAWASTGGLAAVIACAIPGVAALAALGGRVRPGGPAPIALVILVTVAWCSGAALASSGRLVSPPWRTTR